MTSVFTVTCILGCTYYFTSRRVFDFFTLSFFSSVFYFAPGFTGFVPTYFRGQTEEITNETYSVMLFVLVSIFVFTLLSNNGRMNFAEQKLKKRGSTKNERNSGEIKFILTSLTVVAFTSAVGNLVTIDRSLLAGGVEKADLLNNSTFFYNFWVYPSILVVFFSFHLERKLFLLIGILLLLLDVYLYAMRVHAIMALAAIGFYWIYSKGPLRLLSKLHIFVALSPIFMFFFIFKSLARPLNNGEYSLFFQRIVDPEVYLYWLVRAEPFNQVAILNKVLSSEYFVNPLHILMSFTLIVPYSGGFDYGVFPRYHDYFYPDLFPSFQVGAIASNPWAQLMSIGGFAALIVGMMVFLVSISYLNKIAMDTRNSTMRLLVFPLAPIVAFYMHRNDLYFTLLMCKRLVLPVLLLVIMYQIMKSLKLISKKT